MSNGPTHSNRTFKLMRTTTLSEGEFIIETWEGSNYDKETGVRTPVPGALDIKIYNKDPSKEYNKGDAVIFFRVFENKNEGSPFDLLPSLIFQNNMKMPSNAENEL